MDEWTGLLSLIAIIVALGSAAFTGGQWWEARKIRTHTEAVHDARWAFEAIDRRPGEFIRDEHAGWFLRNTGGSHATNVTLHVRQSTGDRVVRDLSAGKIDQAARVQAAGSMNYPDPAMWWVEETGKPGSWVPAELDRRGAPKDETARRLYEQVAIVRWTDDSQRPREGKVWLY